MKANYNDLKKIGAGTKSSNQRTPQQFNGLPLIACVDLLSRVISLKNSCPYSVNQYCVKALVFSRQVSLSLNKDD